MINEKREMPDIDLVFIAEQLKRVLADTNDLKTRMSAIEKHLGRIHLDIAALRTGHLEQRLDQIERRLDIQPSPHPLLPPDRHGRRHSSSMNR
jgi:tetrahydromethanopterin S-methyltransferase subunit G